MTTFTLTNDTVHIEQEGSPSIDVPLEEIVKFFWSLPIAALSNIRMEIFDVKVIDHDRAIA